MKSSIDYCSYCNQRIPFTRKLGDYYFIVEQKQYICVHCLINYFCDKYGIFMADKICCYYLAYQDFQACISLKDIDRFVRTNKNTLLNLSTSQKKCEKLNNYKRNGTHG